jgi:hypothetical protein
MRDTTRSHPAKPSSRSDMSAAKGHYRPSQNHTGKRGTEYRHLLHVSAPEHTSYCLRGSSILKQVIRRRKDNHKDSHIFTDDDWEIPISAITARMTHLAIKERQQRAERRARGKKLRSLQPRSSLSHSELAAEVTLDSHEAEKLKAAEAEQERLHWER